MIPNKHPGSFHFQSNSYLRNKQQHEKLTFGELLKNALGNDYYYGTLASL